MPKYVGLAILVSLLVTGCTPSSGVTQYTPEANVASSPTATSSVTVIGTVQSVALSARVIFLLGPVSGIETIAITERTQIVDRQGNTLVLRQLQPGQSVQAEGERHENALLATRIIVDDGNLGKTPDQGIERAETNLLAERAEYRSNALRITFRYPPTWEVLERGGVIYVYSDKVTDSGAKYYVCIEEYSNPEQQSLEQIIASRWGDDIAQDVRITEAVVGEKKVEEGL